MLLSTKRKSPPRFGSDLQVVLFMTISYIHTEKTVIVLFQPIHYAIEPMFGQ